MPSTPSPLPRRERAVIGFFLYVSSIFTFVVYILWAYLPNEWFEWIGITYYPHKYWAIAVAICVIFLLIGVVLANFLINSLSVPKLNDISLLTDSHARKHIENINDTDKHAIPPVSDLDLGLVNRILYLNKD